MLQILLLRLWNISNSWHSLPIDCESKARLRFDVGEVRRIFQASTQMASQYGRPKNRKGGPIRLAPNISYARAMGRIKYVTVTCALASPGSFGELLDDQLAPWARRNRGTGSLLKLSRSLIG